MLSGTGRRNRQLMKSLGTGTVARIISISTTLITVPITLNYLGAERYGMWMTITSLITLLSFSDFGIGNGLLSSVATAQGMEDRTRIRGLISSAYASLTTVSLASLVVFFLLHKFVDWPSFFNVTSQQASNEAAPTVAVLLFLFAIGIPLNLVQKVQMGLQQTYIANLWQCFSSVATLAAVLMAAHYSVSLPVLVSVIAGTPLLVFGLCSLTYFTIQERDLKPTIKMYSWLESKHLLHTGILFVVLQLVAASTYMSDSIIIAQILGAEAVAEYAIPQKLFSVLGIMLSVALMPLWPAYAEAIASGDIRWIKSTLLRSTILSTFFAACIVFVLIFAGPTLILWWVGTNIVPSFQLFLAFGIWKIIEAAGFSLSMFLNGAKLIKFQIAISVATAICAVVLKIFLVNIYGMPGVLWATSFSYIACVALPVLVMRKSVFQRAEIRSSSL